VHISKFLQDALEADIITKKQHEDLEGLLEKKMGRRAWGTISMYVLA
jgi:hypothetical protein